MITRSQSKSYVVIDFDESSRAWNQNKRRIGNGMYEYVCKNHFDALDTRTTTLAHTFTEKCICKRNKRKKKEYSLIN